MNLGGLFDLDALEEKIAENEARMAEPGFWDDQEKAQEVIAENNDLKAKFETFHELAESISDLGVSLELLQEIPDDEELQADLEENYQHAEKLLQSYQLNMLLSEKYDKNNAILEIHPGAGGTESQDWGSMLLRMYTRWASQHDFKVETVDYQPGDDAGIKSVTLMIEGKNAYGYLRSERGVHRLVRISPFDSAGRRHTSFASVNVMPELDDSVEVELRPEDIKMEVFRASGAGGQHINKTSSAVRITHIPTNIVVACQTERSQIQNRETAMRMLKSKLLDLKEKEHKEKIEDLKGEQREIAWGSQIRSYVFCPYTLVKDHRTGYEVGNVDAVMNGDLNGFMISYLRKEVEHK